MEVYLLKNGRQVRNMFPETVIMSASSVAGHASTQAWLLLVPMFPSSLKVCEQAHSRSVPPQVRKIASMSTSMQSLLQDGRSSTNSW